MARAPPHPRPGRGPDLAILVLVACLAPGAARPVAPSDTTALLQHAVRAEPEGSAELAQPAPESGVVPPQRARPSGPLLMHTVTQAQLADATRHLRGLGLRAASARSCTSAGTEAACRKAKDSFLDQQENVEHVASRYCAAYFMAGYTEADFADYLLLDWAASTPNYTLEQMQPFARQHFRVAVIDGDNHELRVEFFGINSSTWKFVDRRFGCTPADTAHNYGRGLPKPNRWRAQPSPCVQLRKGRHRKGAQATDASTLKWDALCGSAVLPNATGKSTASVAVETLVNRTIASFETSSVAVLQKGRLWERYANNVMQETLQPINSVGKGMLALLLSQWLHEQSQDLSDWASVPEIGDNNTHQWGYTVDGLLNMMVQFPAEEENLRQHDRDPMLMDMAAYAASEAERAEVQPGEWYYATGNYHLATRELRQRILALQDAKSRTGKADPRKGEREYADSAWKRLFDPIGATGVACERDPAGNILLGTSCWATTRDLLRLGLLMLDGGRGPGGEQLVPAGVVERLLGDEPGFGVNGHYILGWYRLDRLLDLHACGPALAAIGVGGQFVVVVPRADLVVARTSWRVDGLAFGGFADFDHLGRGHLRDLLSSLCG